MSTISRREEGDDRIETWDRKGRVSRLRSKLVDFGLESRR